MFFIYCKNNLQDELLRTKIEQKYPIIEKCLAEVWWIKNLESYVMYINKVVSKHLKALLNQGLKPTDGKIIVSGATGGVGSVSVVLLSQLGFDVVALSGKAEQEENFLKSLGAKEVQARQAFEDKARPLNKELYAGGVDVAGGNILANMLSMTKRYGKLIIMFSLRNRKAFRKM